MSQDRLRLPAYRDPPRFHEVERLQICPVCSEMFDSNNSAQREHHHSELEYPVICPVCGQMYDRRCEEHASHHAQAEHNPLLTHPVYRYRSYEEELMSVRILLASLATAFASAVACSPQSPQEQQAQQQAQNDRQPGRGGFLRRADANEDGTITRAEFDASAAVRFARRDDNHDGAITQDEDQRPGGPDRGARPGGGGSRMMNADANEDGTITRAEFDASQNAMFTRLDADSSGAIESSELPARTADG